MRGASDAHSISLFSLNLLIPYINKPFFEDLKADFLRVAGGDNTYEPIHNKIFCKEAASCIDSPCVTGYKFQLI
jgi:hypothetical protein